MKKIKLLIYFAIINCFCQNAFAQYATIPDAQFRKFLKYKYPSCFNDQDLLDTTCSAILTETAIDLNSTSLAYSIDGIHYFKSLKSLNCSGKGLFFLTKLPSSLTKLDCSKNHITHLPELPSGLNDLNCSINPSLILKSIPAAIVKLNCEGTASYDLSNLPQSLQELSFGKSRDTVEDLSFLPAQISLLSISGTFIKRFIEVPKTIKHLTLIQNGLKEIPILHEELIHLEYSYNAHTEFKSFPPNLIYLSCIHSGTTILPTLPKTLKYLHCPGNSLTFLPTLPDSLLELDCSGNQLTTLPPFPEQLELVIAAVNLITNLPSFNKNLIEINLMNNPITCLPKINTQLQYLLVDETIIRCIPNTFDGNTGIIPLCNSTNNVDGCLTSSQILGRVFYDSNKDGLFNIGETLLPNVNVHSKGKQNFSTTNGKGIFNIAVDSIGSYTFTADSVKNYKVSPASITVNFKDYNQEINQDFAVVEDKVTEDLGTQLITRSFGRPGFPMSFNLDFFNAGTIASTLESSFNYPSEFIVDSITGSAIINNGSVSWTPVLMGPLEQSKNVVYGHIIVGTNLGSDLQFYSKVNRNSSGDSDMENNISLVNIPVRGSYDPNEKESTPTITKSEAANGAFIDYIIRFQNMGNDTAFTVVLKDTLSSNLQISSFKFISSSHSCKTSIQGSVITFTFNKIDLLWASVNEPASHGFVSYRMKTVPTLAEGDYIDNKAYIYFDFNEPIITNDARTTVHTPVITNTDVAENVATNLLAFPNPASNKLTIGRNGNTEIYDVNGILVLKQITTDNTIDISLLQKGLYIVRINTIEENYSSKFIKE